MGWDATRLIGLASPRKLGQAIGHFASILVEYPADTWILGVGTANKLLFAELEHWFRRVFQRRELQSIPRSLLTLHLKGYRAPLYIRRNSSDRYIVRQIFRKREYGQVPLEGPIDHFVDAGANIGCASFYLLHQFPDAQADVIEPDPENLALCRRNLEPFQSRVRFHAKGVWPRSAPLRLVRPAAGTGLESTISVVECQPGEQADVDGFNLDELLPSGGPSFDLVKMDIEGTELPVFEHSPRWLDQTHNLMIELHGPESRSAFQRILSYYDSRQVAEAGDVTICTGIRRKVALSNGRNDPGPATSSPATSPS